MNPVKRAAASNVLTAAVIMGFTAAAIAVAVRGFELTIGGALSVYFIVWWTTLFAVLPFGVQSQSAAGDVMTGTEPGAPAVPGLNEKAIWTTIVSAFVFVATVAVLPLAGL